MTPVTRDVARRIHRPTSILFVALVLANMVAMSAGTAPPWLTYAPLAPLFVLMATGLWLYVRPLLARRMA